MPKLCRIHITGFGTPKARFRELALDFTRDGHESTDAVLFLRNGGGKTSLISLFYSVFLPDRSEFLGRRNKKNRHFDEYVTTNQLGVILVELEFPAHGGHRRTFGLTALRRDRDQEAARTFFTFQNCEATQWSRLPVAGLRSPVPREPDALLKYLRAAHAEDPKTVDFYEADTQGKWHRKLESVHFDPAVLRHHLKMNAEEGGVVDLFKHSDPREFAKLFLELTLEPESLYSEDEHNAGKDLLRVQLGIFRQKVAREPETRAIATFCETIRGPLGTIRDLVGRRTKLKQELTANEDDVTRVARSIVDHVSGLTEAKQNAERQSAEITNQLKTAKDHSDDLRNWRRAAENLHVELEHREAIEAVSERQREEAAADNRRRLLSSATLHRQKETNAAQREELRREIERVESDRQPALAKLRELGSQYHRALSIASGELRAALEEINSQLSDARAAISKTQTDAAEAGVNAAARAATAKTLRQQIQHADTLRESLRKEGFMRSGESVADAISRWDIEANRLGLVIKEAEGRKVEISGQITSLDEELRQTAASLAEQERTEIQISGQLEQFESDWNRLAARTALKSILAGADANPWNPALAASLVDGRDQRRGELLRLVLSGQADKRILDGYRDGGVFPPPNDVVQVISRLDRIGIRNAQPLYEYLDQKLSTEADARLRAHPAAYSGVLLQNDTDFERAARELQSCACERPVLLVSRSFFTRPSSSLDAAVSVVLPMDRGFWDHRQAAIDFPDVKARHEINERERSRLTTEMNDWSAAVTELQGLIDRFSEGRVTSLRASIASCRRDIEELRNKQGALGEEISGAKARLREAETEIKNKSREKDQVRTKHQRLQNHHESTERFVPGWTTEAEAAEREAAAFGERRAELERLLPTLQQKESGLAGQHKESEFSLRSLETETSKLPTDYYDSEAKPTLDMSLDALRTVFATRRLAFEQRFNQSAAAGKIELLEEQWRQLDRTFKAESAGLDRVEIEYAAIDDQLPARLEDAKTKHVQAQAETMAAERHMRDAEKRVNNLKRTTAWEPAKERPKKSADASALAEEYLARLQKNEESIVTLRDNLVREDKRVSELGPTILIYENMLPRLGRKRTELPLDGPRHPAFCGDVTKDNELVEHLAQQVTRVRRDLEKVGEKLEEIYRDRIHEFAVEFAPGTRRPALLDRYVAFTQQDVELKIDERISELEQALASARGELASIDQERDLVLAQLDQRALIAERRLAELEKASRMPETITEWAGKPFLQIKVPASHDATDRRQRLTTLLYTWINEGGENIPDGVQLAYATLMAVMGDRSVTMRILKPEYQLHATTYDIADLHKFSGGEKVTAAILLYAVLVRYRALRRGAMVFGSDAGFLLLDNPFGQVTLMQLIDLQVRIARLMGVQLIYATGVADFTALAAFPHRIMLRNAGYNRLTGERYIGHDPDPPTERTHHIDWTVLGERRRRVGESPGDSDDEDEE